MIAMQIMDEIETLEPGEQHRLTGVELAGLAGELVEAKEVGAASLRGALELGFYSGSSTTRLPQ